MRHYPIQDNLDNERPLKPRQDRRRAMIIFTDEEWDIQKLENAFNGDSERNFENKKKETIKTTRDCVMKRVHKVNYYNFIIHNYFNEDLTYKVKA